MEEQKTQAAPRKKITPELMKKIIIGAVVFVVIAASVGLIVWLNLQNRVYTDAAQITAPITELSPDISGTLEEIYVQEGDSVTANEPIARVGDEILKAKSDGLIILVNNDVGMNFNPGQVVVSMIDPADLRVVGHIEEDKGLKNVEIGQPVTFTVDAFGGRKFYGIVDEVSDTSRQSDIVFNISGKREVQEFDVKIRFDINAYPELKNGMSAKIWIYKK